MPNDYYPAVRKDANRKWFAEVREYGFPGARAESGPFRTQREASVEAGHLIREYRAGHADLADYDGDGEDLTPEEFATWCTKYAPES